MTSGVDSKAVASYLDEELPGLRDGALNFDLIAGGRSNLTYRMSDDESVWILRRPPTADVLATAHDMSREFRVIRALFGTTVPVPRPVALCTDSAVIGAPFYVMQFVDGTPYRTAAQLAGIGAERTTVVCERMVDTLADLHLLDPIDVGLQDFGRPSGFLERQARRWNKQLEACKSRPLLGGDELFEMLIASVPDESASGIVHGDYRLDNLLVDELGEVTAVLDWEMASLGDPLTDLALLMVYQLIVDWPHASVLADAPQAPGYLSADQVLARYVGRTGRDLPDLRFHMALAHFKLAAILEGVHYRSTRSGDGSASSAGVGDLVEPLFDAGIVFLHGPV